jgi:hypothetical protein
LTPANAGRLKTITAAAKMSAAKILVFISHTPFFWFGPVGISYLAIPSHTKSDYNHPLELKELDRHINAAVMWDKTGTKRAG